MNNLKNEAIIASAGNFTIKEIPFPEANAGQVIINPTCNLYCTQLLLIVGLLFSGSILGEHKLFTVVRHCLIF
jgi:hypothetical protein